MKNYWLQLDGWLPAESPSICQRCLYKYDAVQTYDFKTADRGYKAGVYPHHVMEFIDYWRK